MFVRPMLLSVLLGIAGPFGALAQAIHGDVLNPPPFPTPGRPTVGRANVVIRTNIAASGVPRVVGNPSPSTLPIRPTVASTVNAAARPSPLQFDAKEKTVDVKPGETEAKFRFAVTNISGEDVTVLTVHTSCGCTAAQLPSSPWILKPGEGGEVAATMNLAGKFGTVTKTVTVVSSAGSTPLLVKAVLPKDAYEQMQRMSERSRNMQVAAADRQAVFRGDCARCHVETSIGKTGKDLFTSACAICHESEHRATMVPGLRGRPGTFHRDYWSQWIRQGKEGTLMPAFEHSKGGPLTEEQIESLADYLAGEFAKEKAEPVPAAAPAATPAATL
jgi:mono/diheme cytochrome c family protein